MSVGSKKRLVEELKNKKFRDAYVAEHVKTSVPIQIYILREQRGWHQTQLAERAKTTQTVISRLEDPDYGKLSIATLLKLASAFDVALLVKFVPFTKLFDEFKDTSPEALSAKDFTEELVDIAAWANDDDIAEQEEHPATWSNPLVTNNFQGSERWIQIRAQNLSDRQRLFTQPSASGAATGALAQVGEIHLGNIFGNGTYSSPKDLRGSIGYGTLERH